MSEVSKTKAHILEENRQLREELSLVRSSHKTAIGRQDKIFRKFDRESRAWIENSPICTKILDLDFNLQFMSSSGVHELKIENISEYYGTPYPFDFYPDSYKTTLVNNLVKLKETKERIGCLKKSRNISKA